MPQVNPEIVRYWHDLAQKVTAAGRGEQTRLVHQAAKANGISPQTAYRRLRDYGGWQSGRKQRQDAGKSALSDEALDTIGAIYREGQRENGKQITTIAGCCSIVEESGIEVPVSNQQVARRMRQERMDRKGRAQAEHFVQMRSEHPNHVHQIDPSVCVVYYLQGRQFIMRDNEFYKNKLDKYAKVKLKVWRYVRTDHASSVIDVRYFEAAGESQALTFEFLCWTWGRQAGRTGHGVPRILVWDKGSANIAHGVQRLLGSLDVRAIEHATERSNVKGQVEGAQNIVERNFEARLRYEPVDTVEELNAAAVAWCEAWNTNSLRRIDSRLRRPGAQPYVRAELWMKIRPEQLRELPPREVCAKLLEGKRIERVVSPQLRVSYRHPAAPHSLQYDLRSCEGVHRGDRVELAPLLIGAEGQSCAVRLRWTDLTGEEQTWRLAPIEALDEFGQPLQVAVWGEEHKAPPKRAAEHTADRLEQLAYPQQTTTEARDGEDIRTAARKARQKQVTPFDGKLDAVSHLSKIETPTYIDRRGTEIPAEAPEDRTAPVPLMRALSRLADAWGRSLSPQEYQWLSGRWAEGMPEGELERLCAGGEVETRGAGLEVVR